MVYNMDFSAALKAAAANASSKGASMLESRKEVKSSEFKDNLTDAVRKTENVSGSKGPEPKREAVKLTERKPLEIRKTDKKLSEQDDDKKEVNGKQDSKLSNILEELMQMLETLSNLQQDGAAEGGKQPEVLESINKLLCELNAEVVEANTPLTQGKLDDIKDILAAVHKLTAEVKTKGEDITKSVELSDLKAQVKELLSKGETAEASKPIHGIEKPKVEINVDYRDKQSYRTMTDREKSEEPQAESLKTQPNAEEQDNKAAAGNKENLELESAVKQREPGPVQPEMKNKAAASEPQEKQDVEEGLKDAINGKIEKAASEEAKSSKSSDKEEQQQEAPKTVKTAVKTTESKNAADVAANFKLEVPVNEKAVQEIAYEGKLEKAQAPQKFDVINQIVKKAELVIREDQPELRMQLEPENLGKLTLKVAVERGLITAKFVAESYEVKQIIESNFNQLKDMLQEKGIGVESFSVSVGHESREFNKENNQKLWQESYKPSARRSTVSEGYGSYVQGDLQAAVTKNPYSYHDGKFDYRA